MKLNKKIIGLLGLVITFVGVGVSLTNNASALDTNSIVSKAVLEGVYQCFDAGAYQAVWDTSSGAEGIMYNNKNTDSVKLPYNLTIVGDNNLNCKEVLFGYGAKNNTLNKGLVPSKIQNSDVNKEIMEYYAGDNGIGYDAELNTNVSEDAETQVLKYAMSADSDECHNESGLRDTPELVIRDRYRNVVSRGGTTITFPAVAKDNDGTWRNGDTASNINTSGVNVPLEYGELYYYSICGANFSIASDGSNSDPYWIVNHSTSEHPSITSIRIASASGGKYTSASTLEFWNERIVRGNDGGTSDYSTKVIMVPEISTATVGDDIGDFASYKLTYNSRFENSVAALNMNNGMGVSVAGLKNYMGLALSAQEVYDLYKYYVKDVYKVPVICEGEENYELYAEELLINWKKGTECRAFVGSENANLNPGTVYGVEYQGNGAFFHFTKSITFDDVVATLGLLKLDELNDTEEGGNLIYRGEDDPTANKKKVDKCRADGGAQSLGWILCPILNGLSDAATGLYEKTVAPNLQIEPQLFTSGTDGGKATKEAWGVFQGIANIFIMVLFLVVIFSQLTGVGIDNYGIKKILPRIIVAAVLMNLSYYICIALVDVSNIVGNSLQGLFDSFVPVSDELAESYGLTAESFGATIASVAIVGGVVAGAIWIGALTVASLLALIPAVFSVIISIFFLFLLLAGRQAAVVVLVIISPLAFVCYTLPNTKKLFDKWVKVGEALLLVYPIASLLVAGGDFVSRLLLRAGAGSDGFVSALMAMLVGIVPIFFIPSVLKKAMDGIGGLGTRLSNLGGRMGRGVSGAVRNSEQFRFQQQRAQERRNLRLSGMRQNENGEWEERRGIFGGRTLRNRFSDSRFGRNVLGTDRMQGRRRNQAQQSQYAADNERLNARLDVMNTQQARTDETLDKKVGEAEAYEEKRTTQTDAQKWRERTGRREAARQTTADNLIEQEGKAREAIAAREEELRGTRTGDVNRARQSVVADVENAEKRAEVARRKRMATETAGVANYSQATLDRMAQNEVNMTTAQQEQNVAEVNMDLARLRARSAFKAQELKNATDMYSTFAKTGQGSLLDAAGFQLNADGRPVFANGKAVIDSSKIVSMLSQAGGAQRLIALTNAMMSNGLENDVYNLLSDDNVARALQANSEADVDFKTAMSSSPEKAMKAFGKKGGNMTFEQFMTAKLGDGGMADYVEDKGADFISGLTDKSLNVIQRFSKQSGNDIMSTAQLIDAAAQLKEKSALDIVGQMLVERPGMKISGAQLAKMEPSIVAQLTANNANGQFLNTSAVDEIARASEEIAANKDLMSAVKGDARAAINVARRANNLPEINWVTGSNGGGSTNQGSQGSAPQGPTTEPDWEALSEPYNYEQTAGTGEGGGGGEPTGFNPAVSGGAQPAPQGGAPEPTSVYGGGASSVSVDDADRLNQIVNESMPGMNSVVDNMMADQLMREASMAANGTGDGRRIAEQLMRSPGLVQALTVDSVKALPDRALIDAISSSNNIEAKQKLVSIAQQMRDNPELARGFTGPAKTALNNFLQFNDPNYTSRGPIQ